MNIEIITPDKTVYEGRVKSVQVPGADGSLQVLENHAPLISTLGKGKIRVVDMEDNETFFDVDQGVIEVRNNKLILLAEKI